MSITQDEISRTKRFEGDVNHLYLDTNGNVTVGVGHLLATAASAVALSFVLKSDGTAATAAEKRTEWITIKAEPTGHPASYYDTFARLTLPQADIDTLLMTDLTTVESQLQAQFADYAGFPSPAQAGLIDMAFNLGTDRLITLFPQFVSAVHRQDWTTAANQCHRGGIQAARNNEVRQLFLQAAQAHPTPPPPPPPKPTPGSGGTGSTGQPSLDLMVPPLSNEPAPLPTTPVAPVAPPEVAVPQPPTAVPAPTAPAASSVVNTVALVGLTAVVATVATVGIVTAVAAVAISKDRS